MGRKSDRTKRLLADSLQQLMEEMPLSKVTVTAVAARAEVDRQTFYYHFEAMDDLVRYLCQERLVSISRCTQGCSDAHDMFCAVVRQVDEHRAVLARILDDMGRLTLRDLFHDDAKKVLLAQAADIAGDSRRIGGGELDFAVEYCLLASASVLAEWIGGYVNMGAEKLTDRLAQAFKQHIVGVANA